MKHLFFAFLLSVTLPAFSMINMKPGLWKIDMKIKANGKTIDPSAQLKAAMKDMPEEQRKQMMKFMDKTNSGIGQGGDIKVCYTKKMLEKPEGLSQHPKGKCTTKVISQTSSKIVTKFSCEDGTTGDGTWNISNPNLYSGDVKVKSPKSGVSESSFKGEYLSADCGNVKPLNT